MNKLLSYSTTLIGASALAALGLVIHASEDSNAVLWPVAGHDLSNSRNQPMESRISKSNVSSYG
jgi:hypothetical protein